MKNLESGEQTIRFAYGAGRIPGITANVVAIDYDARYELGIDYSEETGEIKVMPASWWHVYRHFYQHPDPGYRIATRLAVLSVTLGVVGVVVGIAPHLLG